MKNNLLCLVLITGAYASPAQTFTEKISRELAFEKPTNDNALVVANINGHVNIVAYEGTKILLEVTKSIKAKTDARLERGKSEIQLGILDRADTLLVYVKDGCHEFRQRSEGYSGKHKNGWSYHSSSKDGCDPPYDYKMDFIVKVPKTLNLVVTTINNGDVMVENTKAIVKAGNINGNIRLVSLTSQAEAHTINGDVDVTYAENPAEACRFYTLNGDINALFQPGLSATLSFESFNGSFYTNITEMENLPVQVQKSVKGEGLRYKINGNRYRVGQGGALLDFETFNGNVYLEEKTQ
jgi:hypothetical protein